MDMGTAGILSRLTRTPHTIPMDYETKVKIFQTMEKYGGGFCQKLALAWYAADDRNKQRIEESFSHYMADFGPEGSFWGPYRARLGPSAPVTYRDGGSLFFLPPLFNI
jgi:hypothetical protein